MRELYRYQTKNNDKFGEKWEWMIGNFKVDLEKRQGGSCYAPGGSFGPTICTTTLYSTITESIPATTTVTVSEKCEASNNNPSDLSLSDNSRFSLAIALPLSIMAGIGIIYFIWKTIKNKQNPRTLTNVATNEERHGNQVVES